MVAPFWGVCGTFWTWGLAGGHRAIGATFRVIDQHDFQAGSLLFDRHHVKTLLLQDPATTDWLSRGHQHAFSTVKEKSVTLVLIHHNGSHHGLVTNQSSINHQSINPSIPEKGRRWNLVLEHLSSMCEALEWSITVITFRNIQHKGW